MADTVSKEKRSEIMSHVTGKETKPEKIVRKYLFAQGLRYRKNVKRLPGTPDIVLHGYKVTQSGRKILCLQNSSAGSNVVPSRKS